MLATKFEHIRMHENQTFSSFYSELSDIVNSSFNLREPIPNSKVIKEILKSLLKIFTPKVIAIEESKDIDFMRVDELVGFIQTYEMTQLNSHKPKDYAFKDFENEEKDTEIPYDVIHDELAHTVKRIKRVMKFNKRYKNQESRKEKKTYEQSSNVKEKDSSKGKKFECFNCEGLRHYA